MSLCSLRKSQPSAKPVRLSVDDFINQAIDYAKGQRKPVETDHSPAKLNVLERENLTSNTTMKHATFSLSEDAIQHLDDLSRRTGIAKSRLLRILIDEQVKRANEQNLTSSEIM
ncbi:ribbon-helix-helix domain-containing protein [Alteromonas ponticola]|uniref:Ribbon-helix-helix domain-containing protein n=1 Tax=Alteromonas aquimaris TaxID=2998417 RepID=A0ABT3P2R2_9ALTE|nr:ribbon-helix-helix domain-containing protein [Alteromonas aquimaris]MCW8107052.1 ribbon-helix-helix domain-containing protein [Alteromonas aquimaris]